MSRFERQGTEGGDLPALLGSATDEFRRSLERHVEQIVAAATEQAAEIERDARRDAKQREEQLDLRSQELVQGVVTRAASVLDSIELVQSAISGMLAELRAEVKALESGGSGDSRPADSTRPQALIGADQRIAKEAPTTPEAPSKPASAVPVQDEGTSTTEEEPSPAADTPVASTEPAQSAEDSEPAPSAEPVQETSPPQEEPPPAAEGPLVEQAPTAAKAATGRGDSSAEFDQMIHGEIRRMFQSGKSREDVERFLGRFELGDSYQGLLDELYSQKDPSGRRRIFGRRRER